MTKNKRLTWRDEENEALVNCNEMCAEWDTCNPYECKKKAIVNKLAEYEEIGTVEELRALKEKETEILLKDGQFLYQQGLVDGYAKAIDEVAERLKSDEFQKYNLDMVFETSRDLSYSDCIDAFHEYIDKIAEQLKAGVEDGNK